MKLFSTAAAMALAAASLSAHANPLLDVLLDFESVDTSVQVTGYEAYGVTFGRDMLGVANKDAEPGFPFYAGAPSMQGVLGPIAALDTTAAYTSMNVAGGFDTGLTFFYSSSVDVTNAVQVWDGLNGTGNLLASIDLSATNGACTDVAFCQFNAAAIAFSGVAKSVTFGAAAVAGAGFDNVHIGAVPEAGTSVMMLLGLAGLAAVARRRA